MFIVAKNIRKKFEESVKMEEKNGKPLERQEFY
jgi:hypothetical protein